MSQNNSYDRLAIIGTIPPPFGGVSVHIKRTLELLQRDDIPYRLYDQTGKDNKDNIVACNSSPFNFVRLMTRIPERVVHFHVNNLDALTLASFVLTARQRRYLITLHSEKPIRVFRNSNRLRRKLITRCFQKASHIVCVNNSILEFVRSIGVADNCSCKIPAFLPPTDTEIDAAQIPNAVRSFIARFERIVGTHGWFGFFIDDRHVYGFDQIARLALEIKNRSRHDIGIYTVISGSYENNNRKEILELRRKLGLEDHWLIIEEQFNSAALFAKTDIFIRPTLTDGDSVSIRECLYLGTRVLASDAVARPNGCLTFPCGDYDMLSDAFWSAIDSNVPVSIPNDDSECRCIIDLIREETTKR